MISSLLKKTFDKYYSLPIAFWDSISRLGKLSIVNKESTIKKPSQVENQLSFLISGSGGILLWEKDSYICTDMVLCPDFLCDYLSFITRKATPYEVIIFEKSEVFSITYQELSGFLQRSDHGDKFWRYALEALYIDKHLQYIQSMTRTASEIYKLMQEYQPEIIQKIPQKYIASYLGITPQSLSRIRKKTKI